MKNLQKKFDEYKKKVHSKEGIGEFYERQIRYLYEKNGWRVEPYGILKGKSDLGRDLLCYKKKQVHIVQAKNWSKYKTIHEKHIMQLAGTILHYIQKNNDLFHLVDQSHCLYIQHIYLLLTNYYDELVSKNP